MSETNGREKINTTEATLILDGIHRMFAHRESGFKKIEAVEWKKKSLDYEAAKTALFLESADQKRNPLIQSQYSTTTDFYQQQDGK